MLYRIFLYLILGNAVFYLKYLKNHACCSLPILEDLSLLLCRRDTLTVIIKSLTLLKKFKMYKLGTIFSQNQGEIF